MDLIVEKWAGYENIIAIEGLFNKLPKIILPEEKMSLSQCFHYLDDVIKSDHVTYQGQMKATDQVIEDVIEITGVSSMNADLKQFYTKYGNITPKKHGVDHICPAGYALHLYPNKAQSLPASLVQFTISSHLWIDVRKGQIVDQDSVKKYDHLAEYLSEWLHKLLSSK